MPKRRGETATAEAPEREHRRAGEGWRWGSSGHYWYVRCACGHRETDPLPEFARERFDEHLEG